jgi:lipopolysaccharide assembly outer membrane protein LptD (OstA)
MIPNRAISVAPAIITLLLLLSSLSPAQEKKRTLDLINFDQLNRKMTDSGSVWYGHGNIRLRMDSTYIESDSVIWYRDREIIHFYGDVEAYDSIQHIWARQLSYYHRDSVLIAREDVTLIHHRDSIKAVAEFAEYSRGGAIVYLEDHPRLFLNYPDTANMVDIAGDYLTFFPEVNQAEAEENVVIIHQDTRATCGCAEYSRDENLLILRKEPFAVRDSSEISGELMQIRFAGKGVDNIEVYNEARASFVEESDSATGELSGNSELTGDNITFYFKDDEIRKIAAVGSARSEYYPSPDDTTGAGKNLVSGDTIYIYVDKRRIIKAEIIGGGEGVYITENESAEVAPYDTLAMASDSLSDSSQADSIFSDPVEEPSTDSALASITDSTEIVDSLATGQSPEDSIHYSGGFLEYFASNRILRITGNANVRQGQIYLDAEKIDYDIPGRVVLAKARVDTIDAKDNVKIIPLVLKDGNEEIHGSRLVFNVDTKQGKIENATTRYEQAYYGGRDLYKEEEEVFYVRHGQLTSCDAEEPHFHFNSNKMKLIHDDRVIARPVVFYVETIPVMILPYYVFPLKRGRHSGILPIRLGNFEQGNRYIGNLGYYWAASEYWDIQTSLDFHENIGITLKSGLRYNKRYTFIGNINASFSRDHQEYATSEFKRDRYRFWGNHTQDLPYEISFRASGEFVSDKDYSTDYLNNPEERRNRNIISKASFTKRFGRSSISMSFSHTNNLDVNTQNSQIPVGSFTMPSFHPFGSGREVDGKTIKRWYNQFYVGYRNSFGVISNRRTITTLVPIDDTTNVELESKTKKEYAYVGHNMSVNTPQKIFSYFTINPSVSLTETWYYIMKSDQAYAAGIPADRPYRRGAISAGISTNTDLYGTFPINQFGLVALRHVLRPSVSFSWSPAITKNDAVREFARQGAGGPAQKSIRFSLVNLFQAKIKSGETEKKYDLFQVSSGFSYNYEAKIRKYSDLSTSISSRLIKNVNVSGSLSHNLYDENNQLNWRSPSLRSFRISSSFQARGSLADDYSRTGLKTEYDKDTLNLANAGNGLDVDVSKNTLTSSGVTDFNLNLSHFYSQTKSFGTITGHTHWISVTFNVSLTKNWKFKYSQKYDFIRHESVDKILDLYRKIHCWEGHFYWIPEGSRQGYYFKINIIAIPDIKGEKSESGLRGALFNR